MYVYEYVQFYSCSNKVNTSKKEKTDRSNESHLLIVSVQLLNILKQEMIGKQLIKQVQVQTGMCKRVLVPVFRFLPSS